MALFESPSAIAKTTSRSRLVNPFMCFPLRLESRRLGRADTSVKWLQNLERQVGVSCWCGQVHLRPDNVLLGCTDTGLGNGQHGVSDCCGHECKTDTFFHGT